MIAVVIATGAVLLALASGDVSGSGTAVPDSAHTRVAARDSSVTDSVRARAAVVDSSDTLARAGGSTAARPASGTVLELRRITAVELGALPSIGPVEPVGVALDGFGRLYVSDLAGRRLIRLDATGRLIGENGALGNGGGLLRRPGHVVPSGALSMALLDEENRRVLVYDLYGELQGTRVDFASDGAGVSGHITPIAMASDRTGDLYVADAEGDRVLVYDPSGRLARVVSGFGAGPGALHGLAGVSVARKGDLVVTERAASRVQRLDPSGRLGAAWALPERPAGKRLPVAVDDSLRVAVADEAAGRLWVFNSVGVVLAETRGLRGPSAIAFGRDGALWVAERGAGRLTRYQLVPAPGGSR